MTSIICELNPLHNGHGFLISEAAKSGRVILIMSGNFTQRGSAAVYDKYTRAKAAVLAGADLVLELPFPWCSAGAADFARAGVAIAAATGSDTLTFGSGSGDGELLCRAGRAFADVNFDKAFEEAAKCDPAEGAAKLRHCILAEMLSEDEAKRLSNPNDILGIEYNRYAYLFGGIKCVPVKRVEGGDVTSATEIRKMMAEGDIVSASRFIPDNAAEVFANSVPVSEGALYDIARLLLRLDRCDIENIAECEGGLGFRLRRIAGECENGAELLRLAATKKYTDARIRRSLLYAVLGITRDMVRESPLYTTVLGMSKDGGAILKEIKKSGTIEVLTKTADNDKLTDRAKTQFDVSAAADRLYTALMHGNVPEEYFLSVTPYIEK
ncbi:MAG: nucleotidyltransferase family protein [Ruminococcaceae bacterium]|nr:nucleotidyltransferase family protein [Oscillospiraceae bacterium]